MTSSTDEFELTGELTGMLTSVGVATLSAELRRRGYPDVSIDGVHAGRTGTRLVGRARTLRLVPFRPDLFERFGGGVNAQKRAVDSLRPGDVLVIEARGDRNAGTVGDVLALRAQILGAAGIVTDGAIRDAAIVTALDIPTYFSGTHPSVLGRRHVPWEADSTIACGGVAIQRGDVLVGDDDGIIVIPPALAQEVAEAAVEHEAQDEWVAARVAEGHPVAGLFPMNAEWRERYRLSRTVQG